MKTKSFLLASAAAALFVAGGVGVAVAEDHEGAKVKCEGANACKGKSACKTETSDCSGHNECKGKGYVMLSEAECKAAKAE